MPANCKRSQKQQFQPGNQRRTEWAATPAAAVATAAAAAAAGSGGGGCGRHGEGGDSLADFRYNSRDRKPGDLSQNSGLGKIHLAHVDKNCDMCNFATEHLTLDKCSPPKFQPVKEEKRGVVVAQSLPCVNCSFVMLLFKLYEEIHKPGR